MRRGVRTRSDGLCSSPFLSTDPLAPTPPPPVAKTPSVIEALSQQSKPAQPGVPLSKALPPPLPPQPPSRLPQKRPAPG